MFTILKVRDGTMSYQDPGWYKNSDGTVAEAASDEELRRNRVEVKASKKPRAKPEHRGGHGHH